MNVRKLLSFVILLSIAYNSVSQNIQYQIKNNELDNVFVKNWTIEEGLWSNTILDIGKTHKGELLLLTYNSISLFNGKTFSNYNKYNDPSLKTNIYLDFCITNDSLFWIATDKGIVLFNGYYFSRPDVLKQFDDCFINHIYSDNDNDIWITTLKHGSFFFDGNKIRKVLITNDEDSEITMIFTDTKNNIWIGTETGRLYIYDKKTDKYHLKYENHDINNFFTATECKRGKCFFATSQGLMLFDGKKFEKLTSDIEIINQMIVDDYGQLWTVGFAGVKILDVKKRKQKKLKIRGVNLNQIVKALYFDKESNVVWIGSYREGIFELESGIVRNINFADLLLSEVPSVVTQKNDTTLYVGTDKGSLFEMSEKSCKRINYKSTNEKENNAIGVIKSILVDSKRNIWVCSYNNLYKYSYKNKKWLTIKLDIRDKVIRDIVELNDGKYLLGTGNSGIYQIDSDCNILCHIDIGKGLLSNYVLSLSKSVDGNILYVSTNKGLNLIQKQKIFKTYNENNGLISNLVFNTYQDSSNNIWVATIEGISLVQKDSIYNFGVESGLINYEERVFDIIEDDYGYMWLPTINSIIRIKKDDFFQYVNKKVDRLSSVRFNKLDGMTSDQFISASKLKKLSNGYISFNSLKGISLLDPKRIASIIFKPNLFIKQISTETKNYFNDATSENLVFSGSDKYYNIGYEYVDFVNYDKVNIYYKLIPFDNDWRIANNRNSISYTNLPYGEYKLIIKVVSKSEKSDKLQDFIQFEVQKQWYQSVWVQVLLVFLFLFIFYLLYRYRTYRIKKHNRVLARIVQKRTNEIQQQKNALERINASKDKMFSIIGHDLRNPIGTAKEFAKLLNAKYKDMSDDDLSSIFESLSASLDGTYSLLENLLVWSRNERGLIECTKSEFNIGKVVDDCVKIFTETAEKKNITINYNKIPAELLVNADRNMINLILRNLLSNSIKFTANNGSIDITIELKPKPENNCVLISVSDTGVGINPKTIKALQNHQNVESTFGTNYEKGTGLGLSICMEFLRLHNRTLHIENNKDKVGTTFSFCLDKA